MKNHRTYPNSRRFQTGNVLLITFSHLLNDTYAAFVAPLLPLLIAKLGLSYFLAGVLTAGIRIPALLNPLIGIIADRVRLHYFIILTPAITGVMLSLLGAAPSYPLLVFLTLVAGLSSACYHVTAPVMMKHLAGEKTGRGMSFFMLGGDVAATVGPLVILGAVYLWGLEGTYWLIPFGWIASLFMYLRFKGINIQQHSGSQTKLTSLKQTSKTLFPLFLCLTGISFAILTIEAALTSFLPTYLTAKGVNLWAAGASLSLLQMGGIAGNMMAGPLSDRFGRKNVMLSIVIMLPIFMWLFVLSSGMLIIPLLFVLGMFQFGTRPVMLAIVHDTNSEYPAYVNGIYIMINFVTTSIMILVIGIVGDTIGLENTYRAAATLSIGAIPFVLLLPGKIHCPVFLTNLYYATRRGN
jgi:FSR family fosmidomycin resistance protein-like MFS transporter